MSKRVVRNVLIFCACVLAWLLFEPLVKVLHVEYVDLTWEPDPGKEAVTKMSRIEHIRSDMIRKGFEAIDGIDRGFWARGATTWYASPAGSGTTCSNASPCSISTALCNSGTCGYAVAPGDTINLKAGVYTLNCGGSTPCVTANLVGTANAYITVQGDPAAGTCPQTTGDPSRVCNVTLDGVAKQAGIIMSTAGQYTIYQNFEVYNSNGMHFTRDTTSQPPDVLADCIYTSTGSQGQWVGLKYYNLIVHDCAAGGIHEYIMLKDLEVNGTITYFNGWASWNGAWGDAGGTPFDGKGHGHYGQNTDGSPASFHLIKDFASWGNFYMGYQLYSTGDAGPRTDTTTLDGAILWDPGYYDPRSGKSHGQNAVLGQSSAVSMKNLQVKNSVFYGKDSTNTGLTGSDFFPCYNSTGNTGMVITNNYFMNGVLFGLGAGSTPASAQNCANAGNGTITGNDFLFNPTGSSWNKNNWPTNTYRNGVNPTNNVILVRPSSVTSGRGFVVIQNWANSASVNVDISSIVSNGATYEMRDTMCLQCAPLVSGTYGGGTVSVTMNGAQPMTKIAGNQPTRPAGTPTFTPLPTVLPTKPLFLVLLVQTTSGAATPTNTPTATATVTNTPTLTPSNTVTPTPSLTPQFTNTSTFTPTQTPTVTQTPSVNSTSFSIGTCSAPTAPMTRTADPTVLGGSYASTSVSGVNDGSSGGSILCNFTVPATATYRMWLLVNTQVFNGDSMFVQMDGDAAPAGTTPGPTTEVFDMAENQQCDPILGCLYESHWQTAYQWNRLNNRGTLGCCSGVGTERLLSLTSGAHSVTFWGREIGPPVPRIAYVIVTSDLNYVPSQTGPDPTPTPGLCRRYIRCNNKAGYRYVPCSLPYSKPYPCPWR